MLVGVCAALPTASRTGYVPWQGLRGTTERRSRARRGYSKGLASRCEMGIRNLEDVACPWLVNELSTKHTWHALESRGDRKPEPAQKPKQRDTLATCNATQVHTHGCSASLTWSATSGPRPRHRKAPGTPAPRHAHAATARLGAAVRDKRYGTRQPSLLPAECAAAGSASRAHRASSSAHMQSSREER